MHLDITHEQGRVRVGLVPGEGEPDERKGALARHTATFEVGVEPGAVHPDLLVLSAVLSARPWIVRKVPVTTSVAASPALAQALREGPGLRLGTVDPHLTPRPRPMDGDGAPGLCFSGGTDSVATLAVMPARTRSYHLLRRAPQGDPRATMFVTRAAEQSCALLRAQGWPVEVVGSDVEYLRAEMGFPHDFTTAVPLLLHADRDALDAVAWGAPLEATYRLQRGYFRDFAGSPFLGEWGEVFAAVGLEVCVPVAGVSEVVTSRIVHTHPLGAAAQSCVRGRRLGRPCGRCAKCARKTLLAGAVTGTWPDAAALERQWRGLEPRGHLLADPIKVEPVVAHTVHRYLAGGGDSELLRLVAAKTGPDPLDWLDRSYEPALALVPERYRQEVADRVHRVAPPMKPSEEEAVRAYEVRGLDRSQAQADLEAWFAEHPPQDLLPRATGRVRRVLRARVRSVLARRR
ncbi:hypothetical protein SGUI_3140 [Serinicoccus hydrothermalis]|uniref:Uncharacterized protein n=1 Tax=Serinicoccus hydrothermalis TaxID=1758689 RepID=A0A1B1NGI1_9MICO|nr:DUF6395 domain-containing protein [Serinicoccus hydrothermalis]ANS80536.1 hypothetical protein SGUI_3140 [Serinicoccus hydrothermalis]